jgi:hypothetical protein
MFGQVIRGRVSDPDRLHAQLRRWESELAAGAAGWLGTTAGVTADGEAIAVARFESPEAAQQNSSRPEQTAWWEETAALFTEEPVFHDSTSVEVDLAGDPDEAGFVQVMSGRSSDPERARELIRSDPTDWRSYRPEILGTLSLEHDGDAWTMVMYFSSEEAAREGEKKEPPEESQVVMKELGTLMIGEPSFYDLKDPWMSAPS